MKAIVKTVCAIVFIVAFLNFAVFFIVALVIGGDAVNGRKKNDRYYVASHGTYTEVSETVYNYSLFHVYSVWLTHLAAFLAGGGLALLEKYDPKSETKTDDNIVLRS